MNSIFLRHGTYIAGTLTWATPQEFKPPVMRKLYIAERISSDDLRSINYAHLKSKRTKSYEVVISANDLANTTTLAYLISCQYAEAVQYSLVNSDWATNGVTITFEASGIIGFEYIENHKGMPRLKINLIQKYPD